MFRSVLYLPDVLSDSCPGYFFLSFLSGGGYYYNSRMFSKLVAKDIKLYKNTFFINVQGNIKNCGIIKAVPSAGSSIGGAVSTFSGFLIGSNRPVMLSQGLGKLMRAVIARYKKQEISSNRLQNRADREAAWTANGAGR